MAPLDSARTPNAARSIVRPRDAAGLVLLRRTPRGQEVLLGRRRSTARFLPGIYVFPGGGLELADRLPSGFAESFAALPEGLDGATRRKARALLRAAVRETFEETGIFLGRPAGRPESPTAAGAAPIWQAFRDAGLQPAFDAARLLVRAITPTRSPIRFHTRFFVADATGLAHGTPRDEELEQVAWVPIEEARRLEMIDVTEFVLDQALAVQPLPAAALFSYREDELRPDLRRRLDEAGRQIA